VVDTALTIASIESSTQNSNQQRREVSESIEFAGATRPPRERMVSMSTKTVFTTGEAAKICKVSQQTIIRCFDNGSLKGFRVPGSRFRRIPREQLYSFMKENGIPTEALESGKRKLLIVDDDEELVELMVDVFARDGRFEIKSANNGFSPHMIRMSPRAFMPEASPASTCLKSIPFCSRIRAVSGSTGGTVLANNCSARVR
jgi:two-component system OmpR family response regulator